jgi:hypothetical protein
MQQQRGSRTAAVLASVAGVVLLCTLLLDEQGNSGSALQQKHIHEQQQATFAKMGSKGGQALYDVPVFTEERTRMHFPQAEAGWLDMAAKGQIGDDDKTDEEKGNLTAIITEWHEKAVAEKAKAREDMAKAAKEENYYEYNITKGVANHKLFPAKAPAPAATKAGSAPKLSGGKGPAPKLASVKAASKLVVARGKGVSSLARTHPSRCGAADASMQELLVCAHEMRQRKIAERVAAEERTMVKEEEAEKRIRKFKAKMKETLHLASMKLAHQEMGMPQHRGPSSALQTMARTEVSFLQYALSPSVFVLAFSCRDYYYDFCCLLQQ